MSQAGAQAHAFYEQSVKNGAVWTIRDDRGYPASMNPEGIRVQPFWSSLSRVEKIIKTVPAYSGFQPEEIPLDRFLKKWNKFLKRNSLHVGVIGVVGTP